ncbi:hypothetical protein MCOR02_012479 [Pyricularia oryzae]|nr:hypothetical protein MCOR02_012479 [Pyricularia oryzae]
MPYGASKERLIAAGNSPYNNDKAKSGYFGSNDIDGRSDAGVSAFGGGDMFKNLDTREQMAERGNEKSMVEVEEFKDSPSRKRWVFITWMLTFFVPEFLIQHLGKMPRKDVRMAWREKLAINFIIWFSCLAAAFILVVFPMLVCPTQYVFTGEELSAYNGKDGKASYAAIRGQVSALCQGTTGSVNPAVLLDYKDTNITDSPNVFNSQDLNSRYHDFRYFTNDTRPDWFSQMMITFRGTYKKGNIGYPAQVVQKMAQQRNAIAILNGRVYDFTKYIAGGRDFRSSNETRPTDQSLLDFMDPSVVRLFSDRSGEDVTPLWDALRLDPTLRKSMQLCLDNLFYLGDVDTRNSVRCNFAKYFILAVTIILCSIIAFKFLAALQFGTKNMPENLDKFIMCQIPAYTEDEESLRRAIDSAARTLR